MQIPLGKRQLSITVERVARTGLNYPELLGTSDWDLGRLARTGRVDHDPRWIAILLGFRS